MTRPDQALLDSSRYPFHASIETRFSDIDVNMHVNNVAMCGLLQEGRVRFHAASRYLERLGGQTSMAASLAVSFVGEARHPVPVDLHVAIDAIGRTSHTLAQLVTQEGKAVAFARAVIVTIAEGRPSPNPADFAELMAPWMLDA